MEFASLHNQGTYQALVGDHGHLRGWEELLSNWVGHGEEEGGRISGGETDQCPCGVAGGGKGFPCPEGPTHG